MKLNTVLGSVLLLGLFGGCVSEKAERHETQAQLQAEAKISQADAQKIALAQVPAGTIKEGELEREKGKLIWSFDLAIPGSKDIKEVNVDAMTGQVLGVETETSAQQQKEAKAEAKEKKGQKDKDDDEKDEKK